MNCHAERLPPHLRIAPAAGQLRPAEPPVTTPPRVSRANLPPLPPLRASPPLHSPLVSPALCGSLSPVLLFSPLLAQAVPSPLRTPHVAPCLPRLSMPQRQHTPRSRQRRSLLPSPLPLLRQTTKQTQHCLSHVDKQQPLVRQLQENVMPPLQATQQQVSPMCTVQKTLSSEKACDEVTSLVKVGQTTTRVDGYDVEWESRKLAALIEEGELNLFLEGYAYALRRADAFTRRRLLDTGRARARQAYVRAYRRLSAVQGAARRTALHTRIRKY